MRNGQRNCARYSAAEMSGITVVAAVLPFFIETADMMKGIPVPLARPIRKEPAIAPVNPP